MSYSGRFGTKAVGALFLAAHCRVSARRGRGAALRRYASTRSEPPAARDPHGVPAERVLAYAPGRGHARTPEALRRPVAARWCGSTRSAGTLCGARPTGAFRYAEKAARRHGHRGLVPVWKSTPEGKRCGTAPAPGHCHMRGPGGVKCPYTIGRVRAPIHASIPYSSVCRIFGANASLCLRLSGYSSPICAPIIPVRQGSRSSRRSAIGRYVVAVSNGDKTCTRRQSEPKRPDVPSRQTLPQGGIMQPSVGGRAPRCVTRSA